MVACKQCSTGNSIDSLFCKHCGAAIEAEERSEAQKKAQDLMAEGYKIFNEGRTGEAKLIAEATLADQPDSTSALSLLGMCHERAGEIAEALAAYERVLELNPDSALDKIKVQHLRQTLTGRSLVEPEPRRGRAMLGAAAATILVVAVGIAIAVAQNTGTPPRLASNSEGGAAPSTMTDAFKNEVTEVQDGSKPNPGKQEQVQNQGGGTPGPTTNPQPPRNPIRLPDTKLPPINTDIQGPIGPVKVEFNPDSGTAPGDKPKSTRDDGLDPVIDTNTTQANAGGSKPAEDPGIIEIKVSKPRNTLGGSQPVGANGVEALLKTASQQFLLGKHSQAASSYEAALRSGASAGSTNQRLGQCYANMGDNSKAAAAYRRAIAAYEAQPDSPRTRSALESCRQALKVLGG